MSVGTHARAWVRTGGAQVGDAHDGSCALTADARCASVVGGGRRAPVPWPQVHTKKGGRGAIMRVRIGANWSVLCVMSREGLAAGGGFVHGDMGRAVIAEVGQAERPWPGPDEA